jgi:hypothetical protein
MKTKLILRLALVLIGQFIISDCDAGIVYPKAPYGGEQAVSNLLDSRFLKPLTQLPPGTDLTIAKPFGVYRYEMNYTNLFSGRFLSATRLCAWRFLLTDGTNSAGVDLGYDEKKRAWPEIGGIFYPACPNFKDLVLQTLRVAEQLPQVKKQDFELRYLDFMDLQYYAFWLHGKSSDIIIPVPVYGEWQDYRPYSEGEMLKRLELEVEKKLKKPAYKGTGFPVD